MLESRPQSVQRGLLCPELYVLLLICTGVSTKLELAKTGWTSLCSSSPQTTWCISGLPCSLPLLFPCCQCAALPALSWAGSLCKPSCPLPPARGLLFSISPSLTRSYFELAMDNRQIPTFFYSSMFYSPFLFSRISVFSAFSGIPLS